MLPFLEVEHLPSSSSFYSAVLQPLGLRYLDTEDGHFPSITYGTSSRSPPVFQIRQVVASRDRPLRTSRIVLSAPSPAAAEDAYEFALRANPESRHSASGASAHRTRTGGGGATSVLITDFDGNSMEIAYQPPSNYPSHYTGSTVRYTRSTNDEAGRILDWNYDVASSSGPSPVGPGSASGASRRSYARHPEDDDEPQPGIRRSVTAGTSTYEPATSARENSNGLSAGAVVGTLLGVAAAGAALGGAFTYSMTKSDSKSRGSRDEYAMPSLGRRSTFADKYDAYEDRKPRYVDVERAVEKVRYQGDYPPPPDYRRPPPEYIARYTQVESPRSSPRSIRDVDDGYHDDARGRHPSSRSRASSARPRSESASHREPYAVIEAEHRSHVSARSSRHHPPIVQRSYTYDTPDRESYVSARSHRSNSTVRASGPPPQILSSDPYDAPPIRMSSSRSRSGSRVTTTRTITLDSSPRAYPSGRDGGSYISARNVPLPDSRAPSYISARDIPLPDSRAPTYISARHVPLPASRAPTYISAREVPLPVSRPSTYVSARHVPLPESRVGGRGSKWEEEEEEEDDDADSIAPSDSISCVGSRRSGSGRGRYY